MMKGNLKSVLAVTCLIALILSSTLLVNYAEGQESNPFQSSTTAQSFQASATAPCSKLPIISVKASGTQVGLSPANIVDNDVTTRWSNLGFNSWIQLDLGNQKSICNIDISWHRGNERVNNFVISGSNDGINFVNIFSGKSSGLTTDFEKYDLKGVKARFIRITVTDNSQNNWVSISEIRVNGNEIPLDGPPSIISTIPSNGAKGIQITPFNIAASFNEPILSSSLSTSAFTVKVSGSSTNIAGARSVSTSDGGKTVIFRPSSNLNPSTTYVATVTGIKDLAGNSMTSPKSWSFTTAGSTNTPDFNFAAVGDWSCSSRASETVANIQSKQPELALALGDLSYKSSPDCWLDTISDIEGITKIVIGNHDSEEEESSALEDQYLEHFNLNRPFYSFEYKNAHFLMLSSQLDAKKGNEQYNFANDDLNKASQNKNIKWIIVALHKPLYTSPSKHPAETDFRNVYHPLIDKYGVDLVLQAHNHNYQRSFPISYNDQKSSAPIITDKANSAYNDPAGSIFVTSGGGGRSLYDLSSKSSFNVIQHEEYGILDVKITNGGTKLTGTFYTNDGNQVGDTFTILK